MNQKKNVATFFPHTVLCPIFFSSFISLSKRKKKVV